MSDPCLAVIGGMIGGLIGTAVVYSIYEWKARRALKRRGLRL